MIREKIYRDIPFPTSPTVTENNRLDSEQYYKDYGFARTDILVIQFPGVCNCFYGWYGHQDTNIWHGVEVDEEDLKKIRRIADHIFDNYDRDYKFKHKQFFQKIGRTTH